MASLCVDDAHFSIAGLSAGGESVVWRCVDWQGYACAQGGWGVESAANITALLEACRSACTDGACHSSFRVSGAAFELVSTHSECSSDDSKLGDFSATTSGLQQCADACASVSGCKAFDFGRNGTARAGLCWYEHVTAESNCAGHMQTHDDYDFYRLKLPEPPSPPGLPASPGGPPIFPWASSYVAYMSYNPSYDYEQYTGSKYEWAMEDDVGVFGYERLRAGAECDDGDDNKLGMFDAVVKCAEACVQAANCTYFIYGVNSKRGQCWQEWTKDACKTEGFEEDDFDFYRVHKGGLPPRAPPSPSAPPPALPSPALPPAPPQPPAAPTFEIMLAFRERAAAAAAFASGSLLGSTTAMLAFLECVALLDCADRKCRRPRSAEEVQLAEMKAGYSDM